MLSLFRVLYHRKWLSAVLATFWTLLIVGACLLPASEVPKVRILHIDKAVHFVIFAGFSFLWLLVLVPATFRTGFLVFLCAVILGYLVELLQGSGITTGRSFDTMDIVADAIGGAGGMVLFFMCQRAAMTRR